MSKTDASPTFYHVVSHTHWDREWYRPFEVFRLWLVDMMDHLLEILDEQPGYIFHLDAQTIVLEDYLAIRPEARSAIERFVHEGRLRIGPWYVQNDLFLTSGESTVRNLLTGLRQAEAFGGCDRVGYAPDQFGLIAQLPQILNGFGIDSCVFGRGYDFDRITPADSEFAWQGPAGSGVMAIHLRCWYNNAQRFSADPERAYAHLQLIDKGLRPSTTTDHFLLMNGVDCLEAQEDLLPILEALDRRLPDSYRILQTTLSAYLDRVRASLPEGPRVHYQGELRYGGDETVLQGTLSSRLYLKRANVQAESLLSSCLEPLYVLLASRLGVERYPAAQLDYLWRELLKNHPHDSICGCSCDAVHASMEERYARIQQAGQELRVQGLRRLSHRFERARLGADEFLLTVFNPAGVGQSAVVEARLEFPRDRGVRSFRLLSPQGRELDCEVLGYRVAQKNVDSPINLPGQLVIDEYRVRFRTPKLAPFGAGAIRVVPAAVAPTERRESTPAVGSSQAVIENEYLRVEVDAGGRITLTDKASGWSSRPLLGLEDQADVGDSYCFRPLPGDTPLTTDGSHTRLSVLSDSGLRQSIEIRTELDLPEGFDRDTGRRSPVTRITPVTFTLSLDRGNRRLDIGVALVNNSRDHRLRLLVRTGLQSDTTVANAPFALEHRRFRDWQRCGRTNGSEPNSGVVALSDGRTGVAVLNNGLTEYEHVDSQTGTLAFSLVRANGVISAHAFNPDPSHQLPPSDDYRLEDNQCLRALDFRLALLPLPPELPRLWQEWQAFAGEPVTYFDAVDEHTFAGGRAFVQDSTVNEIFYREIPDAERCFATETGPLRIEGDAVVSTLKRASERGHWVLRVFNPEQRPVDCAVWVPGLKGALSVLRLDETPTGESRDQGCRFALQPGEILTLAWPVQPGPVQ